MGIFGKLYSRVQSPDEILKAKALEAAKLETKIRTLDQKSLQGFDVAKERELSAKNLLSLITEIKEMSKVVHEPSNIETASPSGNDRRLSGSTRF